MNGRQRILTAIARRQADRIPIDFWAVEEVYRRLATALGVADTEGVLRAFDVDLRYFRGPSLAADRLRRHDDGSFEDHWGVRRRYQTVTGRRESGEPYTWRYKHLVHSPLAAAETVADIERHAWPDAAAWDYSGVRESCLAIRAAGCAVVFGGDRLDRTAQLKAAMYLRGTEQFMADLALQPAMAECLLEHVAAYYLDYNRRVFEAAGGNIDVFFMGDDMGTQSSTWVSPEMYRRFFQGRFARFNEQAHAHGAKTMYHTCGKVTALVGQFVEAGLDVLQSLQPASMEGDLAELKRQYGRDLCLAGGIDIQHLLPRGTPGQIAEQVRQRAGVLGAGGGYIFGTAHNILPDSPTENILALIEAYRRFGRYG